LTGELGVKLGLWALFTACRLRGRCGGRLDCGRVPRSPIFSQRSIPTREVLRGSLFFEERRRRRFPIPRATRSSDWSTSGKSYT